MLTLEQILKAVSVETIHGSSSLIIQNLQSPPPSAHPATYVAIVGGRSGQIRRASIEFFGPVKVTTPVIIGCTCESYAYNFAFALAAYGSGAVLSNEFPIRRNPQLKPGACQHIVALARGLLMPKDPQP